MRHRRKPIGGSNPPLSAIFSKYLTSLIYFFEEKSVPAANLATRYAWRAEENCTCLAKRSNFCTAAPFRLKGEFKLGNGRYCYPLTVTDHASRFLLLCEALESHAKTRPSRHSSAYFASAACLTPSAPKGRPFASPNASSISQNFSLVAGSASIERIKPGQPQQNGRHERMHLTLKKEATRPPGSNSLQQQARFDAFVDEFNAERPHEALAMKCPAEVYTPSLRPYAGLPEIAYPFHDRDVLVTACGRLCLHRKRINIATVLSGQRLGIKKSTKAFGLPASCTMILIFRPGAENLATPRQPVRPEVVTHV